MHLQRHSLTVMLVQKLFMLTPSQYKGQANAIAQLMPILFSFFPDIDDIQKEMPGFLRVCTNAATS